MYVSTTEMEIYSLDSERNKLILRKQPRNVDLKYANETLSNATLVNSWDQINKVKLTKLSTDAFFPTISNPTTIYWLLQVKKTTHFCGNDEWTK